VLHNGAKQLLIVVVQANTKTLQKRWDREGISRQADEAAAHFSKIVDDIESNLSSSKMICRLPPDIPIEIGQEVVLSRLFNPLPAPPFNHNRLLR
jgi:hypothetical protein